MQIVKHLRQQFNAQNEEEGGKRISLPQTLRRVKETMMTSIYYYRIPVVGDIIMDKVKPMLRETKMPKNMAEGAKHVIVLFCDAPMKNIKGAIIRAVVVFIHNFPNVRPFSPVSYDVEKIRRVGISFKPFDPSFLFEDRILKFEKSSEFGLELREISLVISGVFGYIVVFKSLNLAFKSLRFFVEVPKSLSRPRTHSFRFQKCEYAKSKLFRTEGRGWGLLADENIKAGQFIIECCGEVISFEEVKKRSQAYESHDLKDVYIISVDGNDFIDSTRKGSLARFINHSCSPNCETSKWIVSGETRVGIFAKQDISVGMELTYEYNFEWYYGGANVHCLCGAANCSLFLGAKCRRFREYNHVWEDGDDRYIVDDLPVYDSTDDESTLVICRTSGGNEHTKILTDGKGSTFKWERTNSATKKSQRKPKLKVKYLVLTFIPCILMSRSNLGPRPTLRS
ncbi:hypothetical protein MTR67_030149 [Solanum verrucosum]|uniref:Uncharacterized protein n=1 Tax=Solanum verrucosum TaxID=315347 RepID=A0AAF0R5I7_SOLVR|nr:hypothetical protein MTR67_030149 [Solanum verrucosum]